MLEAGHNDQAKAIAEDIAQALKQKYIADGKNETTAQKKADASVKSSITGYWKPKYIEAYKSGNTQEMKRIRLLLHSTGYFKDVSETVRGWTKTE